MFLSPFASSPVSGSLVFAPGSASLTYVEDVETLTIPISTNISVDIAGLGIPDEPIPLEVQISGNIVATAAIPEPVSLGLFAMSGLILLRKRRASQSPKSGLLFSI
jgi:hypothetical protein